MQYYVALCSLLTYSHSKVFSGLSHFPKGWYDDMTRSMGSRTRDHCEFGEYRRVYWFAKLITFSDWHRAVPAANSPNESIKDKTHHRVSGWPAQISIPPGRSASATMPIKPPKGCRTASARQSIPPKTSSTDRKTFSRLTLAQCRGNVCDVDPALCQR